MIWSSPPIRSSLSSDREATIRLIVGGDENQVDLRGIHVDDPAIRLNYLTFFHESSGDVQFAMQGWTGPPTGISPAPPSVDREKSKVKKI